MIYDGTVNDYKKVCNSCALYIVLFVTFLIISISISSVFIHFYWYLKKILIQQFIKHINER